MKSSADSSSYERAMSPHHPTPARKKSDPSATSSSPTPEEEGSFSLSSIWQWYRNNQKEVHQEGRYLGWAILLVFAARSSLVEPFKIPSGSMLPTLRIGDFIFVNKFAYGLKLPFSDKLWSHPVTLIPRDPPKRGDVIVFLNPQDTSMYYIKRVVGVPGDRVEVRDKVVYINGRKIPQTPILPPERTEILEAINDAKHPTLNYQAYTEELDGSRHTVLADPEVTQTENFGPISVPAERYFAMGDNRDQSADSRYWGFVPEEYIKGKAVVVWFSWFVDFKAHQFEFHPSRIGTLIP